MSLRLLSGGAAQRLVHAVAPRFTAETGSDVDGTFSAVGAMRAKLDAGEPADMVILTAALVAQLENEGKVVRGSARAVGTVPTGIAVRADDPKPDIDSVEAVRRAFLAADRVYVPDLRQSTAGIHVKTILERMGILAETTSRLRDFANGNLAMAALAKAAGQPVGCTQVTEILGTPGVALVGPLPEAIGLSTVYTAGICAHAHAPDLARRFIEMLAAAPERGAFGFSA
jgi:molybdate transport system substrate-binding protein